jgi:mercuric ion binding protein
MKKILGLLLIVFLMACNGKSSDSNVELKSYSFKIEGMTCEVGCAGLIKRKLSKVEGIESVDVDFKTESAKVSYQPKLITPTKIDEVVNNIAGGIYKVVKNI